MKKQQIRQFSLLLTLLLLIPAFSACGDSEAGNDTTSLVPETTTEPASVETEAVLLSDNLPSDLKFDGYEFRIRTIENQNLNCKLNVDEALGVPIDDAIYYRNRKIEERFRCTITETYAADNDEARTIILAGDDAFDLYGLRCPSAFNYWAENLILPMDTIPNIDLSQPYWIQDLNKSLTINNVQYAAISALDLNVYDLTFILLFNKDMIEDYSLESPYTLVNEGKWTFDRMLEMMNAVTTDLNGDGIMDENDRWGYLAAKKMVLPDFWIGAGELSIAKDENDLPIAGMASERFNSVFTKTFEMLYDTGVYFSKMTEDSDVPSQGRNMFSNGQSLFLDSSFYFISLLREMNADFGIIPYPKFDEAQTRYYSRVSYYWATCIPTTVSDAARTGAILEALACESANSVVPVYYHIVLQTKYSRDEESAAMLELIADSRIVDLGDTTLCDKVRDGIFAGMFSSNNRNLASTVKSVEKSVLGTFIKKIPGIE